MVLIFFSCSRNAFIRNVCGSAMMFRESLSAHAGILDGPSGFFVIKILTSFFCSHTELSDENCKFPLYTRPIATTDWTVKLDAGKTSFDTSADLARGSKVVTRIP